MLNPAIFFLLALLGVGASAAEGPGEVVVSLRCGQAQPLDDESRAALSSIAVRLVETSNFNSARHRKILDNSVAGIHGAYRRTVAGRHLVVSFDDARTVATVGGELSVLEIVVGLSRADYADPLFTIDPEGRVISHGKFNGSVGIDLLTRAEEALQDIPTR